MVANTDIPEIMDSLSYEEPVTETVFLERAIWLQDHGYFKDESIQELRVKLRDLYRKKEDAKPVEPEDVWK